MEAHLQFPTALHQRTAAIAADFFAACPQVDTVLLVNSGARGHATPESDLDMAVLVGQGTSPDEVKRLEQLWLDFSASQPDVARFKQMGRFTKVHLDVIAGEYVVPQWDDGGGPDSFEIGIGNQVAHSAPLSAPGLFFQHLQSIWLPYYEEPLRLSRLTMVREGCLYDLDHVPHFVRRGLYFQAFDRLYKAFQEFLQTLFIARQTYPIAYNKWLREQVVNWLGLPDLYAELPQILSISQLDSAELESKANHLRALLEHWC